MEFQPVVVNVGEMPRANVEAEIKAALPDTSRRLGPSLPIMSGPKTLWTQAAADKAVSVHQVRWEARPDAIVKGRVNGARANDRLSGFARSEEARQTAGAGRSHELGLPMMIRC